MKNWMKTTVAASAIAIFAASSMTGVSARDKSTAEQTRDVAAFTQVYLKGSPDLDITVGDAQSIRVIADADIIDDVVTRVEDGRLIVHMEKNKSYRNIKKLKLVITVPELESAKLKGSGDIEISGLTGESFHASVSGSGDIVVDDAKVDSVSVAVDGSGDIEISGTCKTAKAAVNGSGDVDAGNFKCEDVDAAVRGSGDITVFASSAIDANVMGSGDIVVKGDPENVRTKVRGSGDIHVR